jgi:hypothetical protein
MPSVNGLSACAHFILATIVGRELDIEQLREEVAFNAPQLGVETPDNWLDELQALLHRDLVIRINGRDRFLYRATKVGVVVFGAWMLSQREAS